MEIYQNCNIFNDGAFEIIKDPATRDEWIIPLQHGQPLRFGTEARRAVVRDPQTGALTVADDVVEGDPRIVSHDAHAEDPAYAFALSRLSSNDVRYAPMGVFRDVARPTYDGLMAAQLDHTLTKDASDTAALDALLHGKDAWTIA